MILKHNLCRGSYIFSMYHDNQGSKHKEIDIYKITSMEVGGHLYFENNFALPQ